MGTSLGPMYIPYTYMDPLGIKSLYKKGDFTSILRALELFTTRLDTALWLAGVPGCGFKGFRDSGLSGLGV